MHITACGACCVQSGLSRSSADCLRWSRKFWWRTGNARERAGDQSLGPPTTNCSMRSRTRWRKRSLLVTVMPPLSTNT